ncbi:Piso0_002234 [Millerozyma farinosa CBS 7064]|uniref:Pre-mRNA-splicing factor CWC21 n=1 Tax=Pichia sorbitophila (strain ATCC MYA-4447 / BCRC 22081 / CBS 7064 / NBRC 10061 / NRRL Y-12695) TaxID=559304 RepID=G8YC25_PICSO|nr:Piso0_002234 [Millerozyma farinosa CBS 7064]
MAENRIGLQTPRGTGTSGHVQRNAAKDNNAGRGHKPLHFKKRKVTREQKKKYAETKARRMRNDVDTQITLHQARREIEVKCEELRQHLSNRVHEDEINKQVNELRECLLAEQNKKYAIESNTDERTYDSPDLNIRSRANDKGSTNGYNSRYIPRYPSDDQYHTIDRRRE